MDIVAKKKSTTFERTLPIKNESYHGYIASSDFYKCKPREWKYMQDGVNIKHLLTNEYQRLWINEQKDWYAQNHHKQRREATNFVKKHVSEFKNKTQSDVPRINTRLCRIKSDDALENAEHKSKSKTQNIVEKKKLVSKITKHEKSETKQRNEANPRENTMNPPLSNRSVESKRSNITEECRDSHRSQLDQELRESTRRQTDNDEMNSARSTARSNRSRASVSTRCSAVDDELDTLREETSRSKDKTPRSIKSVCSTSQAAENLNKDKKVMRKYERNDTNNVKVESVQSIVDTMPSTSSVNTVYDQKHLDAQSVLSEESVYVGRRNGLLDETKPFYL